MKNIKRKTLEEMYGTEKASVIKEKMKTSRREKGRPGKASTEEKEKIRREKLSISARKRPNNGGGIRRGAGRGKSGWYKGYWCDSSWELAWVVYNIDHKIPFKRNHEEFEYFYNDEKHNFFPDFIKNDIYYEIKGYKTKQTEVKISQFPHKIVVLYEKDLKEIFDYVIKIYGKNFIYLYEDKKYVKYCTVCQKAISIKNKGDMCRKCYIDFTKKRGDKLENKLKKHNRQHINCSNCKKSIVKRKTELCRECYEKLYTRVNISKIELENLIEKHSYESIGKMFNVSGNAIKKKAKKLGIQLKDKIGYWAKEYGKLIKEKKEKNIKYCKDCGIKLSYKNKSGYCQKCIAKYNFKLIK